jgi:hypothetical protein
LIDVAFVSTNPDDYERESPPDDPDFWVKLRPMMAGDFRVIAEAGLDPSDPSLPMQTKCAFLVLPRMVLSWSHPAPVSTEAIDTLNSDVLMWLLTRLQSLMAGERDAGEKKDLSSGSAPTSANHAQPPSPVSSAT